MNYTNPGARIALFTQRTTLDKERLYLYNEKRGTHEGRYKVAKLGKTLLLTDVFKKIKENLNIVDVVSRYTLLKPRGSSGKYVGLCPLHVENTPSFHVDEHLGLFYCFGCMKGGTVIDFIKYAESIDISEVPKFVEQAFNIKVIEEETEEFWGKFFRIIEEFNDEKVVKKYLEERYGRDVGSVSENFFFLKKGYNSEFLSRFTQEELKQMEYYRIYNAQYHKFLFFGRIFTPVEDYNGKVIGITGRNAFSNKKEIKYLHSRFPSSKTLPLISLARKIAKKNKVNKVFITEGVFDALAFILAGYPAVSLLGVNLTDERINILEREFSEFYIVLDSDAAGINSRHKIAQHLVKSNRMTNTKFVYLPRGKDPDDLFRELQDNFIEEILKRSVSLEDEFINSFYFIARNASPIKTKERLKEETTRRVLVELSNYRNSPIENSILLRLAERTGYPITSLIEHLERAQNASKIKAYQELKHTSITTLGILEQRILSTYLSLNREGREELLKMIQEKYRTLITKNLLSILIGVENEDNMNLELIKFLAVNTLPNPFNSIEELDKVLSEKKNKEKSVEKILKIAKKLSGNTRRGKENEQKDNSIHEHHAKGEQYDY